MMAHKYGFIGLGQMGQPMADNIAGSDFDLTVFDLAGTDDRAPVKSTQARSLTEVISVADTVFLSLPDAQASLAVASEIAEAENPATKLVIDLSTIGPVAAREACTILSTAGIDYADAPVSGGAIGAKAGTITIMWAGSSGAMEAHNDVLKAFSKNQFHIGDQPGQGQALKILNNFLSATAMAATSEAVLYGLSEGIDMKTLLDVVNVSTGQNTATRDKFPDRVLTGTFDAGFKTALLAKDVRLYIDNVETAKTPDNVGNLISNIWNNCDETLPQSDFTRIYEYIRDKE
jgi:3-hydroxyisobutyrate dehydrogenase